MSRSHCQKTRHNEKHLWQHSFEVYFLKSRKISDSKLPVSVLDNRKCMWLLIMTYAWIRNPFSFWQCFNESTMILRYSIRVNTSTHCTTVQVTKYIPSVSVIFKTLLIFLPFFLQIYTFFLKHKSPKLLQLEAHAFLNSIYRSFTVRLCLCTACGGMKVTDFLLLSCQSRPIGRLDITYAPHSIFNDLNTWNNRFVSWK